MDSLFDEKKLNQNIVEDKPETVLGMTFKSSAERRAYFREELRKKLPELKQIEGYPIGEDEDILNLSDPPYYTACPNPWLNEICSMNDKNVMIPYTHDFLVENRHPVYAYHPYHTKVPPTIIEDLIKYYTDPDDVILDIFCGSGMTGVASRETNRKIIECDLSPIATFVSDINATSFNTILVNKTINQIIDNIEHEYGWMYKTKKNNHIYNINYFVWSDVFTCPNCSYEFPMFPYGVKHYGNKVETLKEFNCPNCGLSLSVRKVERVIENNWKKSVPVWVNAGTGKNRVNIEIDEYDLELCKKIDLIYNSKYKYWYPTNKIEPNRYSAKLAQLGQKHITDVSRFLSKRNLLIFSALWDSVLKITDVAVRNACKSLLTSIFTVVSERQGYFGGGGGMSGNLYMPIIRMEKNIFDTLRRKIKKFNESENSKNTNWNNYLITTQSSTNLSNIKTNSIDFIYTDPPFGANIMYSEMNLILEGWLKVLTNNEGEAIIDETGNKNFIDYGNLMTKCFQECFRVLKEGHWMCVEFHNTKASIWNLLQNSINASGFVIAQVSKLDKGSTTILADIRPGAAVQDLIITCYKKTNMPISNNGRILFNEWEFIDEHLNRLPIRIVKNGLLVPNIERYSRILYDRLVAYCLQLNIPISLNITEFQKGLNDRFIQRDGMYFTSSQVFDYEDAKKKISNVVSMAIIVSDEANGIEWLKHELETPQTYQDIQPKWMQAINGVRKGDILPELRDLLEENFIKDEEDRWRNPDMENAIDLERLRTKALMKEFRLYVELAQKPKSKIKEVRVEALRAGFKQCYKDKDYELIVLVGDKIPENILTEDEVLLQYYDIASSKI